MEMHQLRYVVAVARSGNFSRAAARCHVSQPSLSQQIQKLEEELDGRLFDRMKREAKLTPRGEAFLPRAVRILEEADAARREATEAMDLQRGTLSIGVLPTLAPYLLPGALTAFMRQFPGVEVVVQEDTTARLLQLALGYEVDLVLASHPVRDARLEIIPLFKEPLFLALPPGHALLRKSAVTARDLEGERLIVMREGHCLGDQVLGFCDRQGARPLISFRGAQLETIQALVATGMGLALIPRMALRADPNSGHQDAGTPKPPAKRTEAKPAKPTRDHQKAEPSFHPEYRPFQTPRPDREIIALWPRQRPPGRAAHELLRLIKERFPSPDRPHDAGRTA
ncbi:MAG: hydrogen peroxide-inducible genes activator [Verrucomicrobiaceae bacterium]|nr:MAG: hydrogen peroxide-inducible genes activator [Verrucomicrobiaceae bacterium]